MKIQLEPGDVFRIPSNQEDTVGQHTHGLVITAALCLLFSTGPKGPNMRRSKIPEVFIPMFKRDKVDVPEEVIQVFYAICLAMNLPRSEIC